VARITRRIKIHDDLAELFFDPDLPGRGQTRLRIHGHTYGPCDLVGRVPAWELVAFAVPAEELRTGRRSYEELTEQAVFFGEAPPPAPATPADYADWAARKVEAWRFIAQFLAPIDARAIDRLRAQGRRRPNGRRTESRSGPAKRRRQ